MAELLPHEPPMVLLDSVIGWQAGKLKAAVEIRATSLFVHPGRGAPAHVGIEYMAQACGAYAGLEAKAAGQPIRPGFLLGTRHYMSRAAWFGIGERLVIGVEEILRQGPMCVFQCHIENAEGEVASARLNLYQPENAPAEPPRSAMP
jgi:predicted hotdog family 3-hydroxylacyl-ACP dehydratase